MPGAVATLLLALAMAGATTGVAQRPAPRPDSVARGALVIHHWDAAPLATRLLDAVSAAPALPALPEDVLAAGGPVHIFLAPDPARFDSLTRGEAPEWGAGIALPEAGVIVLPAYASRRAVPRDLARILRHELAHIALHRHLAPARIPRWFHEGYARWAAGELDWEAGWQLRLAFLLGRAPPLDSLTLAWPASETEARVAYLLSASTIQYLAQHGGVHGLGLFLARWKEEGELEAALWRTYGLQLPQFEEAWRRHVRRRYGWLVFFSHSAVFWAFAGAILLALFGLRRRRDRVRLAHLRATEPPDEPAYWLEQAEADAAAEPRAGGEGREEEPEGPASR
jgi:hypothetical protein